MNIHLDKLIIIGDRVLIKPNIETEKTKSGLYLPAIYKEKEEIQSGYILKCGPGYAMPSFDEENSESWKPRTRNINYLPLQVKQGDLAIFTQRDATEIKYEGEKYFIVPQHAILLV